MKTYRIIITFFLLLTLTVSVYSQDLEDIIEELKGPLELTEEQEGQFSNLLGQYAVQLNEAMAKNEDSDEKADPKEMISQFKSVRDSYRDDLQKILSEEQYAKYQEIVNNVLFEMFTDIASIRIMDLKEPLELTDEQAEQLAPVMGKSLMEVVKIAIEYGDKRMSMPRKVKIGKKMKAIQSEAKSATEKILTPEQMAKLEKMKEDKKENKEN